MPTTASENETIWPASETPFKERAVMPIDDRARQAAAVEIIKAYLPEQLARILSWCDDDLRCVLAAVQARRARGVK